MPQTPPAIASAPASAPLGVIRQVGGRAGDVSPVRQHVGAGPAQGWARGWES